jgi:hypothetical protein
MSSTPATQRRAAGAGPRPERRVRHQAQDVVAVMAFSGAFSVLSALALLLLTQLGR